MIRTPREWDEPCRECRGSGTVHKRERFHLWTPEEAAKFRSGPPTINPMTKGAADVPANAVVCDAIPGGRIFEACKEAVVLARRLERPVAFEFNDAVVVCHADSDPEEIVRRWWVLAYGRTYEESMKNR